MLYMSVVAIIVTTSPLIGYYLSEKEVLATVPIALLDIAIFCVAYAASILMKNLGRKTGLIIGALLGALGGAICMLALSIKSFALFSVGSICFGCFFAFAQYYRFVAAELTDEQSTGKAISYVLAGGLLAAFLGPFITRHTRDIFAADYSGNYLMVIILCLISIAILFTLNLAGDSKQQSNEKLANEIDNTSIFLNPVFMVAIIGAITSYGIMALLMTATPLAMQAHQHSFDHTTTVIQWHLVGMFAPSFFTGSLIKRFGVFNIMLAGGALMILSSVAGLNGLSYAHFIVSLLLLGLGWNFLFIGSSTLLADSFTEKNEKAKAQGLNETFVSATMIVSTLSAGVLHAFYGWYGVNILSIVCVGFALLAITIFYLQRIKKVA